MNKPFKKVGIPFFDNEENRVFIIPDDVERLKQDGIEVLIVASTGSKSNYTNKEYKDAGANIILNNKDLLGSDIIISPYISDKDFLKNINKANFATFFDEKTKLKENDVKNVNNWINLSKVQKNNKSLFKESQEHLAGQFLFYSIQGNQVLNSGILFSKIPGIEIPKIVIVGNSYLSNGFMKEVLKSGCELTFISDQYEDLININLAHSNVNTLMFTEHDFVKKIKEADIVLCSGIKSKIIRQSDINNMKKSSLFIDADKYSDYIDIKREKNFYIHNNIKHYIPDFNALNQSILKSSSIHLSIYMTDFLLNLNQYKLDYIVKNGQINDLYKTKEIKVEDKDIEKLLNNTQDEELSWLDIEDQKDY